MSAHPDRTEVVAQAKADLEAAGTDVSSPCGAWAITNLAASRMRAEGAGLLDKPFGNNCQGFAVDIIAYPDGQIYDVLIRAETDNLPAWQDAGTVDPSRWRPPLGSLVDPPDPPDPPAPGDPALAALDARLTRIEQWIAQAPR